MPGVTVTLSNAAGPVGASATTGADGSYLFEQLPLDTYTVTVSGLPDSCNVPTVDPDDGNDNTSTVTLTPDVPNNLDQDFGYDALVGQAFGSIGDTIYCDENGNGAPDAGEGIAGITVTLGGAATSTATTDANGRYLFENLLAGDYTVAVDPANLPEMCNIPAADPDGGNDNTSSVTLGDGEINLDQDFGYSFRGCIGNYVWLDDNADGVQDANEAGIPSVNVTIQNEDGAVIGSMLTDENGLYQFCNLPAGNYTVSVVEGTLASDLVQTYELDATLDGRTTASLAAGQIRDDVDFGYYRRIDLALNKTASTDEAIPNQPVSFVVTVVNEGQSPATGVSVADALPAGINFVDAAPSVGSYDSATGIWQIGDMAVGQSVSLTMNTTISGDGPYTNTARSTAQYSKTSTLRRATTSQKKMIKHQSLFVAA